MLTQHKIIPDTKIVTLAQTSQRDLPECRINIAELTPKQQPAKMDWVIDMPADEKQTSCCDKSSSKILTTAFSFFTAVPIAVNAFVFPNQPKDLTLEWLRKKSAADLSFAIALGIASIVTNMLTNHKYMRLVWDSMQALFKKCVGSVKKFFGNSAVVLLGLISALVAAGIAFDALLSMNLIIATISAIFNFMIYGSRRTAAIIELVQQFQNLFSTDCKFQKAFVNQLHFLKEEYKGEVEAFFQNKPINENTAFAFLKFICDKAVQLDVNIFREQARSDYVKETLGTMFDIVLGLFCVMWAIFPVGIQKGFRGLNILTLNSLDNLTNAVKGVLGMMPGIANGAFYFISAFDFRNSIFEMIESVKRNSLHLGKVIMMICLNGMSSLGYYVVADGVLKEENIMGLKPNTIFSQFLLIGNAIAPAVVLTNNTDSVFKKNIAENNSYHDFVKYLKKHRLPKNQISALKQHSFFKKRTPVPLIEMRPQGNSLVLS